MTTPTPNPVIHHLRRAALLLDADAMADRELLEAFLTGHDEVAFTALVRRHGPMVLGVCRRTVGHPQDAEDAFQATFLVLARKAAAVRPPEAVGPWLYGVAYRTARRARAVAARRAAREKQVTDMPQPLTAPADHTDDLHRLLDEELNRLPDTYRLPVVLCELQGRSRKEAADLLKLKAGTLSSRLAAARKMLAGRLARRGLALSTAALAAALTHNAAVAAVPPNLIGPTAKAAALFAAGRAVEGAISASVASLTEGVLKTMLLTKIKVVTVVFLALGLLLAGLGAGGFLLPMNAAEPVKVRPAKDEAKPEPARQAKTDGEKMQGKWNVVELKSSDEELNQKGFVRFSLEVKEDRLVWVYEGGDLKDWTWTFSLAPNKSPKNIDFKADFNKPGGKVETKPRLGIYEVDGDRMKICFSTTEPVEERHRPTAFTAEAGQGRLLMVLERAR